eukprot:scaffold160441_cov32-Tisochrysis_lutea.AAC.3
MKRLGARLRWSKKLDVLECDDRLTGEASRCNSLAKGAAKQLAIEQEVKGARLEEEQGRECMRLRSPLAPRPQRAACS